MNLSARLKAPFPWFGGKSRAADLIWERFGATPNYVEPFAGSLAVLLGRPFPVRIETVNDKDCYLANFWRAATCDAAAVARAADWPVNECDLHARHRWLHEQKKLRERMERDPFCFDARVAGFWVWGLSCWIGDNWCRPKEQNSMPSIRARPGNGVNGAEFRGDGSGLDSRRPQLGSNGVHANGLSRQMPQVGSRSARGVLCSELGTGAAPGVEVQRKRPMVHGGHTGKGVHQQVKNDSAGGVSALLEYFYALQERLRRVRVCCGDWTRVLGPSVTEFNGVTGVLLDPPYGVEDRDKVYNHDSKSLSAEVRAWAIANGQNRNLRIALCGYESEHKMPADWECVRWKTGGGYGNQRKGQANENGKRERIWFSPGCLKAGLF